MRDYDEVVGRLRANGSGLALAMAVLIETGYPKSVAEAMDICKAKNMDASAFLDAYMDLTATELMTFAAGYDDTATMERVVLNTLHHFTMSVTMLLGHELAARPKLTEARQ